MKLDPEKMLERCNNLQWSVDDFDWSKTPEVKLSKEDEIRLCQYYMDMSYIERIAGNLFLGLSKRLDDPTLVAIYETFIIDELRHSHAAAKLMDYFDVHNYKVYTPNPAMLKFIPYFSEMVETLNPAYANSIILAGELILDVALLRGINEYVDDPMSRAVMEKINQDESRHLAMDFFMTEYCSSHNMKAGAKAKLSLKNPMIGLAANAPTFLTDVFFRPMDLVDPSNKQMEMIAKRLRRISDKKEVGNNPAIKQARLIISLFENPVGSRLGYAGERVVSGLTGIDFSFVRAASAKNLYKEKDEWGDTTTALEMADEILQE